MLVLAKEMFLITVFLLAELMFHYFCVSEKKLKADILTIFPVTVYLAAFLNCFNKYEFPVILKYEKHAERPHDF